MTRAFQRGKKPHRVSRPQAAKRLRQHRAIRKEVSDRIFAELRGAALIFKEQIKFTCKIESIFTCPHKKWFDFYFVIIYSCVVSTLI